MTNLRVLAVIPARGGSKGLPRKNIVDLAGKPLIAWTIEASLNSKYITKTVVSSDDKEISSVAREYGLEVVQRPENLASDDATSESVVKHVVDFFRLNKEEFDVLILLQPTSPLRTSSDIDNAFLIKLENKATAVISVTQNDNKILKSFKYTSKGFLEGISNNSYPFTSRHKLPKTYLSNGAIYIVDVEEFIKRCSFLTDETVGYSMEASKSYDIDTQEDLAKIARLFDSRS